MHTKCAPSAYPVRTRCVPSVYHLMRTMRNMRTKCVPRHMRTIHTVCVPDPVYHAYQIRTMRTECVPSAYQTRTKRLPSAYQVRTQSIPCYVLRIMRTMLTICVQRHVRTIHTLPPAAAAATARGGSSRRGPSRERAAAAGGAGRGGARLDAGRAMIVCGKTVRDRSQRTGGYPTRDRVPSPGPCGTAPGSAGRRDHGGPAGPATRRLTRRSTPRYSHAARSSRSLSGGMRVCVIASVFARGEADCK